MSHIFWRERRAEAVSNQGPSTYQPTALPLGQTGSQHCCSSQALFSVCLCLSLSSYTCPCTCARLVPLLCPYFDVPKFSSVLLQGAPSFGHRSCWEHPLIGLQAGVWLQLVILGTAENGFDGSEEDDWFLRATLVWTFSCPVERSPAFGL